MKNNSTANPANNLQKLREMDGKQSFTYSNHIHTSMSSKVAPDLKPNTKLKHFLVLSSKLEQKRKDLENTFAKEQSINDTACMPFSKV